MSTLEITNDLAISALEALPVGILLVSNDGEIVYANPKAEDIFDYSQEELIGQSVENLMPERYRSSHKILRENYMARPTNIAMSGGRVLAGLRKNKVEVNLQIGLTPLNKDYILLSCIESTNEIIKPSFSNDPLTGLPNRKRFDEYSEKLRKLAMRNNKNISVAFIDLDNFKSVNDQFGHQIGDMLLCEVANKLINNVRENDIVSRVGGDEFVVCFYDAEKNSSLKENLDRLLNQISSINQINGKPINIGASIGAIITCTPEKVEINEMVEMADQLMYKAKTAGKGLVKINEINVKD